ncbi:hypothetical protein [Jiella endophytica]|nr:hypothetical protein [Jiella endophytica]
MRRLIIGGRRDVGSDEASTAIDAAIAELIAARAEINAGNLKRASERVAS